MSTRDQLDQALEALDPAAKAPAVTGLSATAAQREANDAGEILRRLAQSLEDHLKPLAKSIAIEGGKPVVDSRAEVEETIWTIDQLAKLAPLTGEAELLYDPYRLGWLGFLRRHPYRTVGAITGASFPLLMPALAVLPALTAGCNVVLKPARATLQIANELRDLWLKAGGNPQQLAILNGPGTELGPALCADPRIEALVVYGSRKTALSVQRVARFKPTSLHFGGPGVVVVGQTHDLKELATEIVAQAFTNNGQTAFAPKLILATPACYTKLRKLLAQRILDLKSGPPLENHTEIGPLPSSDRAEALLDQVEHFVANGAQLICGGKHSANFVIPTFLGLDNIAPFLDADLSGPVLAISQIDDFDALPELLGPRRELLVSLFETDDIYAAGIARRLSAQAIYINSLLQWQAFAHCIHESAVHLDSQPAGQLFDQVQTKQRGYQFE